MVTQLVAHVPSSHARNRRRRLEALLASQSAAYVPYRRRTATNAIRVATGVTVRDAR